LKWYVTPTLPGKHELDLVIIPEFLYTSTGNTSPQSTHQTTKDEVITVTTVGKPITNELWEFSNTPLVILIITLIAGSGAVAGLFRRHRKGGGSVKADGPSPSGG
jgi:hypothetical protein